MSESQHEARKPEDNRIEPPPALGGRGMTPPRLDGVVGQTEVPLAAVGPVVVAGEHAVGNFKVPFSTTEAALARTYDAGMRCFGEANPVRVCVEHSSIHISPMFKVRTGEPSSLARWLAGKYDIFSELVSTRYNHCRLVRIEPVVLDELVLCKFVYDTMDAQGLNTINDATSRCLELIAEQGIPGDPAVFLRSHFSAVKHHSLLNEHTGYGKRVRAEGVIPANVLQKRMKVSAKDLASYVRDAHRCAAAAGVLRMNIHAANGVAAVMLATGQDIADLVNAGTAETQFLAADDGSLRVELVLFNLNVATVGGGTTLPSQTRALEMIQCRGSGHANKLAEIIAATVMGGEVATVAAILRGTFVKAHISRRGQPVADHPQSSPMSSGENTALD